MGPTNKGKEQMKQYKTRSKKTSWMSDMDYWHLLDADERALLEKFNRAYYGCDCKALPELSSEAKSSIYSQQYRQRQDAMNNRCYSLEPILNIINQIENKDN